LGAHRNGRRHVRCLACNVSSCRILFAL
jgi:hypothetical protein